MSPVKVLSVLDRLMTVPWFAPGARVILPAPVTAPLNVDTELFAPVVPKVKTLLASMLMSFA